MNEREEKKRGGGGGGGGERGGTERDKGEGEGGGWSGGGGGMHAPICILFVSFVCSCCSLYMRADKVIFCNEMNKVFCILY